jgi:hypothetical protein
MTPGNGQPVRYNVSLSEETRTVVKQLHAETAERGEGQRFISAFRKIINRLQTDPLIFGEPLYRLPALRLLVRQATVAPLVVDYAVHETKPLVFIRGFKTLS